MARRKSKSSWKPSKDPIIQEIYGIVKEQFPYLKPYWFTWKDSFCVEYGQPMGLGTFLQRQEQREYLDRIIYRVSFYHSRQAAKFLEVVKEKGWKAYSVRNIKRQGLNWVRTKTFKTVAICKEFPRAGKASDRDPQGSEDAEG